MREAPGGGAGYSAKGSHDRDLVVVQESSGHPPHGFQPCMRSRRTSRKYLRNWPHTARVSVEDEVGSMSRGKQVAVDLAGYPPADQLCADRREPSADVEAVPQETATASNTSPTATPP
jgi:hypothetical protein